MSAPDTFDFYDAPLPREEFERRVALALAELDGPEGDEMQAHIAWFKRRYPTPTDRVRYARRRYEAATEIRGAATRGRATG
jgi:hypothetical protein